MKDFFDGCNIFVFNARAGSPGLSKGCDSAVWGEAESQTLGRVRAGAYFFWFMEFDGGHFVGEQKNAAFDIARGRTDWSSTAPMR